MDDDTRGRAIELLGRFNDELTRVIDAVYGTRWAEIEEMIALVVLASERVVCTRRLAEASGLGRRAISRLVLRLQDEGIVTTRPSEVDRRAVDVVLTEAGVRQADELRRAGETFLDGSEAIAREISRGLAVGDVPPAPSPRADALDLLRRVCESGARLVSYMPAAATRGRLAARQRAALVLVATLGSVRPAAVSDALEVSPAGAAYIIDQLCAKGFLTRVHGVVPDDRRAVVLQATSEGLRAVGAVAYGIEQESASLAALFAEVAARGRG
ncbi:MAG: hypothetical protein BGO45_07075 [Microbacterium sp. 71-36]|uniref:MarR family winged helix-turn-helix transcriptional regulator n=1 Tax=unclassified Microbacterium TaxID=2609290 RepID=UPI00086A22FE|nr:MULTISPECIES: winged helix DNA-binding protein [unclassified Microbacterium]MBN9211584.1 winged helix DNA-binding protein [Microbacterium sp.]ODT38129.1 MAG: hypothetical protein ABS60_11250 [Microbacterium sp. SCN 71-17]OJV75432.1 MAG: hypothetical protein BGO45_07075 [Microbacterium sp. 71-36]